MRRLTKIFSSCVALPMAIAPVLSIASCSNTTSISFDIPDVVTEDYFEVDCKFSSQPSSSVQVQLVNPNSSDIRLVDPIVIVEKRKTKLRFEILTYESTRFSFKIQFKFNNSIKKRENIISETKEIHYSSIPEPTKNRIVPAERRLTLENNHIAEFNFVFYISSRISVVDLEIINKTSPLISLEQVYCNVEYVSQKGQWIAKVRVNIDHSISTTSFFSFDLSFSFTNTFGVQQTTIIPGLSIAYIHVLKEEMPEDFFYIEKSQGQNYTLVGLNDWVDPNLASLYSVIRIPEYVTVIAENALWDDLACSNVQKIIFNQKLLKVGFNAFGGCSYLSEIDISSCEEEPFWIVNAEEIIFSSNNIYDGYIWVNDKFQKDYDFLKTIHDHLYEKCALPNGWKVFTNLDVTPKNLYETDISEEQVVLKGFSSGSVYQLSNYRIIKIPDDVDVMTTNCLNALSMLPYRNPTPENSDKTYLTRRLILNKKITSISNINFCGIGGPLIFKSPQLQSIPSNCFQNLHFYNFSFDYHDVEYEPISIHFINCVKLETIEEGAFYGCNASGKLFLPSSLKTIKESAFGQNTFQSVSISSSFAEIELSAFASPDGFSNNTITEIDLSQYLFDDPEKQIEWVFKENQNVFKNACANSGFVYFNKKAQGITSESFDDFKKDQGIPKEYWLLKLV